MQDICGVELQDSLQFAFVFLRCHLVPEVILVTLKDLRQFVTFIPLCEETLQVSTGKEQSWVLQFCW